MKENATNVNKVFTLMEILIANYAQSIIKGVYFVGIKIPVSTARLVFPLELALNYVKSAQLNVKFALKMIKIIVLHVIIFTI